MIVTLTLKTFILFISLGATLGTHVKNTRAILITSVSVLIF